MAIQYILYIFTIITSIWEELITKIKAWTKCCYSGGRKHVVDELQSNGIDHCLIETLAKSRRRWAGFNCTKRVSSQCSKCDVGLFLGCKMSFHKSISYAKANNIAMIIFQKNLWTTLYFVLFCITVSVRNTISNVTQYCVVCFAKGWNKCEQKNKLL